MNVEVGESFSLITRIVFVVEDSKSEYESLTAAVQSVESASSALPHSPFHAFHVDPVSLPRFAHGLHAHLDQSLRSLFGLLHDT